MPGTVSGLVTRVITTEMTTLSRAEMQRKLEVTGSLKASRPNLTLRSVSGWEDFKAFSCIFLIFTVTYQLSRQVSPARRGIIHIIGEKIKG